MTTIFRNQSPSRRLAAVVIIASALVGVIIGIRAVWPFARDTLSPYLGNTTFSSLRKTKSMCAQFKDASGLYPDNKVLLLGVEIGVVTSIAPESNHVVVHFNVPADLDLPADVGAASYTQSVITNRSIELTKPYDTGLKFSGNHCIPIELTFTPVTVTESFTAINNLTDMVMGKSPNGDPAKSPGIQALSESIAATARSVDGAGPDFRKMLANLNTMVGDPYKADADFRQLFDNAALLTSDWLVNWQPFADIVSRLPEAAKLLEGISSGYGAALAKYTEILPILIAEAKRFGDRTYKNLLDKIIPWARDILNAYTPALVSFFTTLPPIVNWLADDFYLPNMKTHNVTYIPPRVAISPEQAGAICAELRARNTPGNTVACAPGIATDPVTMGLTNLIMGAALS